MTRTAREQVCLRYEQGGGGVGTDFPAEMAQRLADLINTATGHEVIICVGEGTIIAATLRERIGTRHEGARRILAGEVDEIAITAEDERRWQGGA